MQEPVLERVGADQPQPRAGAPANLGPDTKQHGQALARVVPADEDDVMLAVLRVGMGGHDHAVRHDLEAAAEPALSRLGGQA